VTVFVIEDSDENPGRAYTIVGFERPTPTVSGGSQTARGPGFSCVVVRPRIMTDSGEKFADLVSADINSLDS
jgi:hypothetical protein